MRPGLDADDIYIMVEDELLATAQLYTAHLHHAEYQRLKALARTRSANCPDVLRPVSGPMLREEAQKKKAAEGREKDIAKGLEPMLSNKKLSEQADNERSDVESEQEENPWQGTHLQRFMTVSPRKEMRLIGLHGMASGTRAAAGYSAPETSSAATRTTPSKLKYPTKASAKDSHIEDTDGENNDDDDDDDDLDAPVSSAQSKPPNKATEITSWQGRAPTSPQKRADNTKPLLGTSLFDKGHHTSKTQAQAQKAAPKRSFLDIMTPIPEPTKPRLSPSPTPRYITMKEEEEGSYEEKAHVEPKVKLEHTSSSSTATSKSESILQRLKAKREKAEKEGEERKRGIRGGYGVTRVEEIPIFLV